MYFSKWKNFIITFLIFLAIYQTTRLWFENFSFHSFFYLTQNNDKSNTPKDIKYTTESILINTGNNKFIRKYNNISKTDYKKMFDEAIYLCLKKGDFNYIQKFDINQILDTRSIVYTYDFMLKGKDVENIFGIKGGHISKIEQFDTIVIVPYTTSKFNIKTIFLNSKTSEAYETKVNKETLAENIFNIITDFSSIESQDLYFVSSQQIGVELFSTNQFLPKKKDNYVEIQGIEAINPLDKDGGVLLSDSENYVDIFFENPITKTSSFINNTYTYSDDNVIVKYYPNGVLEYVKYKNNTTTDMYASPYNIAIQFLEKDINIKNEYYLKKYEIEEDKVTFYFDYKINNFPIKLSKNKKDEIGMDSMIEITVENNMVSKYKRVIYDFILSNTSIKFVKSFIDVIDSFLAQNGQNIIIDKMQMVYNFDDINNTIYPKWLIVADGKNFYEDID